MDLKYLNDNEKDNEKDNKKYIKMDCFILEKKIYIKSAEFVNYELLVNPRDKAREIYNELKNNDCVECHIYFNFNENNDIVYNKIVKVYKNFDVDKFFFDNMHNKLNFKRVLNNINYFNFYINDEIKIDYNNIIAADDDDDDDEGWTTIKL